MEMLDSFEIIYWTNLAKWLLHGVYTKQINLELERQVVDWIERQAGWNFVTKLRCIFDEFEEAKKTEEDFEV